MPLTDSDRQTLRVFRGVAADVRTAFATLDRGGERKLRVVNGYIEADGSHDSFRRLSVPLRRTVLPTDKSNFQAACRATLRADAPAVVAQAQAIATAYDALLRELDEPVNFGGRRVTRREMFRAWLDARIFYDDAEKCRPYDEMLETLGVSVEGTTRDVAVQMSEQVLALDDLIASADLLPYVPPEARPPEPPEPKRSLFSRVRDFFLPDRY